MNSVDPAIIGALLAGLLSWAILLPLARGIPLRLAKQWDHEFAVKALSEVKPIDEADYALPVFQRVAVVGIAIALGFVAVKVLGGTAAGVSMGLYFMALLLLAVINLKHGLLPDVVALTVLWAGLVFGATQGGGPEQIFGAAVGYATPYAISLLIKARTGKEAIGHGDMKTLAMTGAWVGLGAMPTLFVVFIGVLIVSAVAYSRARKKLPHGLPTGPAHLVASVAVALGARMF